MKVSHIMTKKTISVKEHDTLDRVIKILSSNNITGCPVVDDSQNIIGIVTQTDVLRYVNVYGKVNKYSKFSSLIQSAITGGKMDISKLKKTKVKDFCRKKVVTISETQNIRDVIRVMDRYDVERLPVVNRKKLVGILTRKDVIKALSDMQ